MITDRKTIARARKLRRPLTDAERILWSRLKGRALGWHFRVQHPLAPYILDFACVRLKLAVEVDGATHASVPERLHDERRAKFLERAGWTTLRFWNREVYENLEGCLRTIGDVLPPPTQRLSSPATSIRSRPA